MTGSEAQADDNSCPPERFPTVDRSSVGWVTTEQMIEVDRVMVDDLGISLLQMMENAGRNLARAAIELFDPNRVLVIAGTGGNGGGGLVAARHLANVGIDVAVVTTRSGADYRGVPAHQLAIVERLGLPVSDGAGSATPDLVIDGILGYSLAGAPRGRAAQLIEEASRLEAPVLSLDTPSGLDTASGEQPGVAVSATATLTLAAPKVGLAHSSLVGELYLADISVPPFVLERLGVSPAPMRSGSIVRLAP